MMTEGCYEVMNVINLTLHCFDTLVNRILSWTFSYQILVTLDFELTTY